jgi:hypothetical protein
LGFAAKAAKLGKKKSKMFLQINPLITAEVRRDLGQVDFFFAFFFDSFFSALMSQDPTSDGDEQSDTGLGGGGGSAPMSAKATALMKRLNASKQNLAKLEQPSAAKKAGSHGCKFWCHKLKTDRDSMVKTSGGKV